MDVVEMTQEPTAVAASLRDVCITHGLLYIEACTDTHVITVEEPSIWSDDHDLITVVRERDQ